MYRPANGCSFITDDGKYVIMSHADACEAYNSELVRILIVGVSPGSYHYIDGGIKIYHKHKNGSCKYIVRLPYGRQYFTNKDCYCDAVEGYQEYSLNCLYHDEPRASCQLSIRNDRVLSTPLTWRDWFRCVRNKYVNSARQKCMLIMCCLSTIVFNDIVLEVVTHICIVTEQTCDRNSYFEELTD